MQDYFFLAKIGRKSPYLGAVGSGASLNAQMIGVKNRWSPPMALWL